MEKRIYDVEREMVKEVLIIVRHLKKLIGYMEHRHYPPRVVTTIERYRETIGAIGGLLVRRLEGD